MVVQVVAAAAAVVGGVEVHSRETSCMWECFELTRCGAACEKKLCYNLAPNSSSSSSQLRRVRWWDWRRRRWDS